MAEDLGYVRYNLSNGNIVALFAHKLDLNSSHVIDKSFTISYSFSHGKWAFMHDYSMYFSFSISKALKLK